MEYNSGAQSQSEYGRGNEEGNHAETEPEILPSDAPHDGKEFEGVEDFPDDVRRFIADHIHSLAQLEVLLLLQGASERAWQAPEVGTARYTPAEMAGSHLQDLCARGIIACDDTRYRYVDSHKFHDVIGKVAELRVRIAEAVIAGDGDLAARSIEEHLRLGKLCLLVPRRACR